MNLAILAACVAVGVAVLWLGQTLLLVVAGEPWRVGPLRHRSETPLVRWGMKFVLQAVLLGLLFGFPAILGEDPIAYHRARLLPADWGVLLLVFASSALAMLPMFGVDVALGWVKIRPQYKASKSARKVLQSLLTPLPLAFVEEALFRGVVFDQLGQALTGRIGGVVAVLSSAAIFSAVHFIRPPKRVLLPALGLFGLGVILAVAYVAGGRSYWLPVGVHAGGVLVIQLTRPFVEFRGPPWLIGYSSYPICGLFGVVSMALYVAGLGYAIQNGYVPGVSPGS